MILEERYGIIRQIQKRKEKIPLYPEELSFKIENGADALFDKLKEKGIKYKVVDIDRKNAML